MYQTLKVMVKKEHPLYNYCDGYTKAANNLRNATLFRVRQVLTMCSKPEDKLTDNEREVRDEIAAALPLMGNEFQMPTAGKTFLSYKFLYALMKATENPDFYCPMISKQSAEAVLREVVKSMKSFYAGCRARAKNPEAFTGKQHLPGYSRKGGNHTAVITNQDGVVYARKESGHELKLPLTTARLNPGNAPIPAGRLKQVTITPTHGIFVVALVFDNGCTAPQTKEPNRICSIDLGVNNFAAITNNIGVPNLLFKGGIVKCVNQYFNKRIAKIQSEQTKGTTNKFVPTPESEALSIWRENRINDYMNKTAVYLMRWCQENDIDTIVIGVNKYWKQYSNLGHVNNQNFVQIPFAKFREYVRYRAERLGINVIENEEYLTSQASFVDRDPFPSPDTEAKDIKFSGRRIKRGLYRNKDGSLVNADLNAGGNIGRKAIPGIFEKGIEPDFSSVVVIKHPDEKLIEANRKKQRANRKPVSKSRLRRLRKKRNPLGIVLCE